MEDGARGTGRIMPMPGAGKANTHKFIARTAPGEKSSSRFGSFMADIPFAMVGAQP
jgi:hypothetical protein